MLFGTCSHALTVRYRGNGGLYPVYLCSGQRRNARATRDCMVLRCDLLDAAIAAKVLQGVPSFLLPKVMAWTPLLLTASVVPK
jgi:hypothetical protein